MNTDKILRTHLLNLLKGGNAHMTLDEAVTDFPGDKINVKFPNGTYSSWDLLEHIRITQSDILNFITNDKYESLEWPGDYWPSNDKIAGKKDWQETIKSFEEDLKILQKIVNNPKTNLYTKIKHGTGQTILREVLLVADHNAYHIGEFAIMRQALDTWGKNHS
jgi:hypothetical protein